MNEPSPTPAPGQRGVLVASNRLPFRFREGPEGLTTSPSPGGLVSALTPVLEAQGGQWVGWPGTDAPQGLGPQAIRGEHGDYRVVPLPLSEDELAGHYYGASNACLWPLFHSLVDRTVFDPSHWGVYDAVNRRFAAAIAEAHQGEDLVWIHDYQLLLVPGYLRPRLEDQRLAFFLHIPFPSFDIFRLLPRAGTILRSLLTCDLIGFHVEAYQKNFLDCVERILGYRTDPEAGWIEAGQRIVRAAAFPLGIDFARFDALARQASEHPELAGKEVVLGVDRLDYTKGIPERLLAYEQLLEDRPELREQVVLLQLAVPSRSDVDEYQALKDEIDREVGRINGRFGTASWTPIRYLYRSLPQEELAGLYRDASVALVTPLRDGMNLVAKEYVACQVRAPGVLVLSRLAGAAETMPEALLVNPYDRLTLARELGRALDMENDERRSRLTALRRRERRDDVFAWVEQILAAARGPADAGRPVDEGDFQRWLGRWVQSERLFLFLDYDGTLAEIAPHPSEAVLSDAVREVLRRLVANPGVDVAVVSGRALSDVEAMVALPGVIYAGNHGLEIAGRGLTGLEVPGIEEARQQAARIARGLHELAEHGAWVEEKGPSLSFHFRQAPAEFHDDLSRRAKALITAAGFEARDAKLAVEARPAIAWDKGRAVLHVLRALHGEDWAETVAPLYAGDDRTDEDAFRVLAGLGQTYRIGQRSATKTLAARNLANPGALCSLLDWIERQRR